MKIYLFDTIDSHKNLLPLSFTRPVADFRCGIVTIREKWEALLPGDYAFYPVNYLREKYGDISDPEVPALFIAGNLLPRPDIIEKIKDLLDHLNTGIKSVDSSLPLAFYGSLKDFDENKIEFTYFKEPKIHAINYVFDIFLNNPEEIKQDYSWLTKGRVTQPLPSCVRMIETTGKNEIFIEEGAVVECASINVNEGPVYIGKKSVLMEGACIRGPFALCEEGEVRMCAKIYEGTTIGPHCKVGGEVSNAVFFGYSNKSHDGYLGNAVIGEWCNIGAGANASNLKNDYSLIKVWNYATGKFMRTDLQFCGLIMGDHSKIGVNCMINTATVMGVGVNLHGCGFPRTYLPNFSEGSAGSGFVKCPLNKFMDIVERVMSRRGLELSVEDRKLLTHLWEE